jgi:hypothetical protein
MQGGVSLRANFPVYTPTAIVTDFTIDSVATMSFKTRQQLATIVTV